MDQVIDHFIKSKNTAHGYGLFKNERTMNHMEKDVVDFAMNVSKSQIRKYLKYKIVPAPFISYFRYLQVIPEDLEIPKGRRTIKEFADLLCKIHCKKNDLNGLGALVREQKERILKDLYPEIHVMFGIGEKLGKDLHKFRHGLPLKNNTKIKTLWNLAAR